MKDHLVRLCPFHGGESGSIPLGSAIASQVVGLSERAALQTVTVIVMSCPRSACAAIAPVPTGPSSRQ